LHIFSLCENIEYLERKCEELNVTLQSMKSEHGKNASGHGKVNRNNAYSSGFGSDSSEEEMSSNFGVSVGAIGGYRRRSHSLQDLRWVYQFFRVYKISRNVYKLPHRKS